MNVDIIVPTYKRYEMIQKALESVWNQTYLNWDCWIAEDGQTKATHDAIKPFLEDKRFHYLPGKHSGTPATPRNRALLAGHSEFVAFLDDDDLWMPHKLARQIDYMTNHPDCVLCGCNALIITKETEKDAFKNDALPLYFRKAPFGRVSYANLVKQDYLINSTVVIPRWVLNYAGIQNETLHPGPDGEDYDLWLRIGVLGDIWLMSEPLIYYRETIKYEPEYDRSNQRRQEAYHTKFKIYNSALTGVGDMPSPLSFPEHEYDQLICARERNFCARGPKILGRLKHDIHTGFASRFIRRKSKHKRQQDALDAFRSCRQRWQNLPSENTCACIVFSKDRALQLHALLSSYFEKVISPVPLYVLYDTTNTKHQSAYQDVMGLFTKCQVHFVKQARNNSFKRDLLDILFNISADKILFLVDDIVFTESVDMNDFIKFDTEKFVPSLRLGGNLSKCYVLNNISQPLPLFTPVDNQDPDKLVWQWHQGEYDWQYPLSVDGHLFSRREITAMSCLISFNAPNSFEDRLQIFKEFFSNRYGIAYQKSKIVNIPCNRVQTEIDNLHGNTHQDELLQKWQNGYALDYKSLFGCRNVSVHQEILFSFTKRERRAKID